MREFWITQSDKWAESIIAAKYCYTEGNDYIIGLDSEGFNQILSVDVDNTGKIEHGVVISNGVQQFLQIKHGLRVTPEHPTTSFISNVSFFKKFENRIYGLTGTIGEESTQQTLKEIYGIELGFMPTFKRKQLIEFPYEMWSTETEWIEKNTETAINEAKSGKAVLLLR